MQNDWFAHRHLRHGASAVVEKAEPFTDTHPPAPLLSKKGEELGGGRVFTSAAEAVL
jgi:hypothetical protein